MSELSLEPGRSVAMRLAVWAAIVVAAGGAALYWAAQREVRTVDATVTAAISAVVEADGTVRVEEELTVQSSGGSAVRRTVPAEGGAHVVGVRDSTGRAVPHTVLEVDDGVMVTVPVAEVPTVLLLRYDLLGVASTGMDAAELRWTIADDRNTLALNALVADLRWDGAGEPGAVDVEAPGGRLEALPRPGGLRLEALDLPAHRPVEVHLAIPRDAVPQAEVEDRMVMEDMVAADPSPQRQTATPAAVPLVVAALFGAAWAVVHLRHAKEPDVPPVEDSSSRPTGHPPALVGWVLSRGAVGEEELAATAADLHARRVIDASGRTWRRSPTGADGLGGDLAEHERLLLAWLFGDGLEVDTDARAAQVAAHPSSWRQLRRDFTAAVERTGRASGLLERSVDAESVLGAGIAASSVVVAGVIGTALGQPAWLVCVAVGALALVFTDTLARRSPAGAQVAAAWLGYAERMRRDPEVARADPAAALTFGFAPDRDPVAERILDVVERYDDTAITASSFLAPPRRRMRAVSR